MISYLFNSSYRGKKVHLSWFLGQQNNPNCCCVVQGARVSTTFWHFANFLKFYFIFRWFMSSLVATYSFQCGARKPTNSWTKSSFINWLEDGSESEQFYLRFIYICDKHSPILMSQWAPIEQNTENSKRNGTEHFWNCHWL